MSEQFEETVWYGLGDLPMEPPDDPGALYSPVGFGSIGMQRGVGAQFVPAQFRIPRQRPRPVGPNTAPGWPARRSPAPEIATPKIPDWLKTLGAGLQLLPRAIYNIGGGDNDAYNECVEAANGSQDDWARFCNSIDRNEENNVIGRQSAKQACRSKTLESKDVKINWCENQYGNH